jgi:hypothetical protein
MIINKLDDNSATIPVAVDAVKDVESFRMTRCTYFTVESSAPSPGWELHNADIDVSFFMLGLSGIITSPATDNPLFDTPEEIDYLFDAIERNDELYVEINDVWIPNELFKNIYPKPQRGHVFRIGSDLFRLAYLLRDEVMSDDDFLQKMTQANIPVTLDFSEGETSALANWNQRQIEINRKHYHENPQNNLPAKKQ